MVVVVAEKQNVERTGNVESRQFQIAASAEAFRILSDGLYSDKVTAILRELGTNAIDAHVDAGTLDKPFSVHLPNEAEPWLKIRDYGTGMDHEKVMSLYSTYFGTDKLDNPNAVGQLGLGSKSPLSYTRSFTVASYRGGEKNQYVVMLNEDRLPEINHLPDQSGKTTEPDGVEIQIAVKRGDFHEFSNKAARVYQYFTHKPEVCGNTSYTIADRDTLVSGQGWRIYAGAGMAKAIMGNIAYPIQADRVHDVTPHQRTMLNINIEIDFPIGSLEFTPSRETLSYKKRTSEVIRKHLDEIIKEVNAEVSKRFTTCKSLWEARVLAHTLFWDANSDLRTLQQLADIGTVTYQGQTIQGQQLHFDKIQGVEASSFNWVRKSRHSSYYYGGSSDDYEGADGTVKHSKDRKYFNPKKGIVWVENDLPRGSYARCEDMIRRKDAKEVNLLSFATQEARKAFCDAMGLNGDEFIKVSTLPKPAVQRGVFHQSTSQVYKHTGSTSEYRFYKYWKDAEVDLSTGGVYVEMRRNKAYVNNTLIDPAKIGSMIEALRGVGHAIEVIGVRPSVAKQFRKSDDWVDVYTYTKNVLRTAMVSNDLGKHLANSETLDNLDHLRRWKHLVTAEKQLVVNINSPLRLFLNKVIHLIASGKLVKNKGQWQTLAELTAYSLTAHGDMPMDGEVDKVFAMYPMLKIAMDSDVGYSGFASDTMGDFSVYVNLVDQKNRLTNPNPVV